MRLTLVLEDLTDAQIESIRNFIDKGKAKVEESKLEKWEPKGGGWYVDLFEAATYTTDDYRKAGLEYPTKKQAEQALKAIKAYARQLAWLAENDDGWVADWGNIHQRKYYVYFDHIIKAFAFSYLTQTQDTNLIFTSEQNAEKLCKLLNDGIVEF